MLIIYVRPRDTWKNKPATKSGTTILFFHDMNLYHSNDYSFQVQIFTEINISKN